MGDANSTPSVTHVVRAQQSFSSYPFTSNFHPEYTVDQLRSALRQHEQGSFYASATLAEALGRDPAFSGFVDSRIRTGLSAQRRIVAATHENQELAAHVAKEAEGIVDEWHDMSVAVPMWRSAIVLGFALAQSIWTEDGWPVPEYWDSANVAARWMPDRGVTWCTRSVEVTDLEVCEGDPRWVLFVPGGRRRGWMDGVVRSVAEPWLGAKYARRDWLQYSERHGLPIIKGMMPAGTNWDTDKVNFVAALDNLGSATSVALTQGQTPGDSYDLQLLEATANTWQNFKSQIDDANSLIAKRILGTDAEAQPGGLGSGAADAGESQRVAIARGDAVAYAQTIREQVLKPWAEYVYGDAELAPFIEVTLETSTEKTARAAELTAVGAAIQSLRSAGVPKDVIGRTMAKFGLEMSDTDALLPTLQPYLQYGIFTDNEVRHAEGYEPREGGDKPTGMPAAAGFGMGALSVTPGADVAELAAEPEATTSETKAPVDEATDGVVQARPVAGPPTYQARRAKAIEAIEYTERINAAGRSEVAKALKPEVEMLLRELGAATDYDDAKKRVLDFYKDSDDSALHSALAMSATIAALAGAVSQT